MAVTDQQKLDFLLKKIGFTKTKTGSTVGTGAISGTPKQPFAEAIPSPLIIANGALWNESDQITTTPPGSDTDQIKVYSASSALRMTADATSSGQRAYIAYSTYGNTSSARLTNWIDTQFGALYLIKVYKGDPNSGGVALSAGATNENWFFDYSAGVLNFNDSNVPSGVTDTNIYIVGYRYIGQTGAPTSGISTFSFKDLTVERNLDVGPLGGISTFRNSINALDIIKGYKYLAAPYSGTTTTFTVTVASKVSGQHRYHGQGSGLGYVIDGLQSPFFTLTPGNTYRFDQSDGSNSTHQIKFYLEADKTTLYEEGVTYNGSAGNSGAYTQIVVSDKTPVVLHYQCINHGYMGNAFQTNANVVNTNHEATLRGGLNVTGVSTFYNFVDINSNIDVAGNSVLQGDLDVDGHTNLDNVSVVGVSTFTGNIDLNGDLDVDGHTNLDNVSIAGITTMTGNLHVANSQPSIYLNDLDSENDYSLMNNNGTFVIRDNDRGVNAYELLANGTNKFNGLVNIVNGLNIDTDLDVDGHTNLDNVSVAGVSTFTGDATFSGSVSIGGTLTYEDVTNVDSVGLLTARAGIDVTGGVIEALAGENKIPSLYANLAALPNAGTYHGMFAHVHSEGRGYFAHAGNWLELVNKDTSGNVGLSGDLDVDGHTNLDNVSVAGVTTFAGAIDLNADLDVDGHTNLDNVSIAGVTTTTGFIESVGTSGRGAKLGGLSVGHDTLYATIQPISGNTLHLNYNAGTDVKIGAANTKVDLDVNGDVHPKASGNRDLGLTNRRWRNVYGTTFIGDGDFVDLDVDGHTNLDNVSVAGVTTFTGNIDANGDLDVDGHTNLDNVSVVGISTFGAGTSQNTVKINHNSGYGLRIERAGKYLDFNGNWGGQSYGAISASNGLRFISGAFSDIQFFNNTVEAVRINSNGNTNFYKDIDVDGHTNLDNVSIAGVSTFAGAIDLNADLDVDGHTNLDNVSVAGVTTFASNVFLGDDDRIIFGDGGLSDAHVRYDGSHLQFGVASGSFRVSADTSNFVNYAGNQTLATINSTGVSIPLNLDVDGHTNLDNISVAGVSTFTGRVDANGGLKVDQYIEIMHYGGSNYIRPSNGALDIITGASTNIAKFQPGGGVDLYFNGTKRFETENTGINVTGNTETDTLNTGNATFTGTISAGGATGSNGQYLKSTGSGVAWASFPSARSSQVFTASAGQTTFSFSYTVGLVDVFVNGIKLSNSEFTATNGTSIVLAVGSFVGDIVEILSYNVATGGGGGNLSNIVQDVTPQLGGNLDLNTKTINGTGGINITGVVTATTFVGDGSGLTGITASGSGVIIKHDGSTVGTAGTINFGTNLDVSPISAGIVTITASGGGTATTINNNANNRIVTGSNTANTLEAESGLTFDGTTLAVTGSQTISSNLTVTGDIDANGDLDVDGHTNLDNVSVAGVSTFTGTVNLSTINSTASILAIHNTADRVLIKGSNRIDLADDQVRFQNRTQNAALLDATSSYVKLYQSGNEKLSTTSTGVSITGTAVATGVDINGDLDVDGHTNLDNVSIAGVVTATTFKGSLEATSASFSSNIDANGDLDVDGHTNLDNVSVAGVTTFAGAITAPDVITAGALLHEGDTDTLVHFSAANTIQLKTGGVSRLAVTNSGVSLENGYLNTNGNRIILGDSSGANDDRLVLGNTNDLQLFHDASDSYIQNATGVFYIQNTGDLRIRVDNTDAAIHCVRNGAVELYHNNIKRLETSSVGVSIPQDLDVDGHTNLDNVSIAGVVTATSFVGDGSGLTGITASGSGVLIKHDGNNVGTAGTINFSTNLDVSAISAGIVTITASGGGFSPDAQGNLVAGTNAGDSFSGTDANHNVLLGLDAGTAITTADGCIFIGQNAGEVNTTRGSLVAIGNNSGTKVNNAYGFTALGGQAGQNHQTGQYCVYIGYSAGRQLTGSATDNTIIGGEAHYNATSGSYNVSVGKQAMSLAADANNCTAVGTNALQKSSQGGSGGDNNTALGYEAGDELVTGSNCTILGFNAQASSTSVSNEITLGNANVTKFRIPGIGVTFKDNGGTPTQGHVLTVDANGEASFAAASGGGSSGISTVSGVVNIANHLDVDGHTELDNVNITGVTTFASNLKIEGDGSNNTIITESGSGNLFIKADDAIFNNASGSTFLGKFNSDGLTIADWIVHSSDTNTKVGFPANDQFTVQTAGYGRMQFIGDYIYINGQQTGTNRALMFNYPAGADYRGALGFYGSDSSAATAHRNITFNTNGNTQKLEINPDGLKVTGICTATSFEGDGSNLTGVAPNVGITTNLSGSFTASAGSPSTINTFGYGSGDIVVEYTVFIKNGSNFQTQKLLAMRDGTTIHSTQFAVMFSSSLLVQLDATISSGNILLRATPETGVSGSTTYKVKREVM